MNVYPLFIAKSFSNIVNVDFYTLTVENLLYLLYKKIFLGDRFNIRYIKQFFNDRIPFNLENIDTRF